MGIEILRQLYCDKCDVNFTNTLFDEIENGDQLRKLAAPEGWRRIKGKDVCPECSKKQKGDE